MDKPSAGKIHASIRAGTVQADAQSTTEEGLATQYEVLGLRVREVHMWQAAQDLSRSRGGPAGRTFVNRQSDEEVRSNLNTATALLVSLGVDARLGALAPRWWMALRVPLSLGLGALTIAAALS